MNEYDKDILIIGQGVAGTCLAWTAIQHNLTFDIYDYQSSKNTSSVSSGIVNPLTGPKFVKSWKVDEFMKTSKELYTYISDELGENLIDHNNLWRHLPDAFAENIWNSRLLDENYDYLIDDRSDGDIKKYFKNSKSFKCIKSSFRIRCNPLIALSKSLWLKSDNYIESKVDFDQLIFGKQNVQYKHKRYKFCVVCLGHYGVHNSLFESPDYRPVKGEILIVEIEDFYQEAMVKFDKFILPLGNNLFWIGSNYQFDYRDEMPDKSQISSLIEFLDNVVCRPYRIVDHWSGIRPATRFRRPFIGYHHHYKRAILFNGLGTKGVSMAPYFSRKIIHSILSGDEFNTAAYSRSFKEV